MFFPVVLCLGLPTIHHRHHHYHYHKSLNNIQKQTRTHPLKMKSSTSSLFMCLILLSYTLLAIQAQLLRSQQWNRYHFVNSGDISSTSEKEYYFPQRLTHFDATNNATFQQRYFISEEYLKQHHSTTKETYEINLLYICGEAMCPGTPNNYAKEYAKQLNSRIFTVEHRYYGKSVPFQTLTGPNLRYLTTSEALADLATFIEMKNEELSPTSQRWIAIGCSYPGALSAWFRLKYPHLVVGALSSSGVINAIYDFYQFDEQVSTSAGDKCASRLREITKAIEIEYANDPKRVKALFHAERNITDDGDFFFMMADIAAETIQYGFHDELCNSILQDYHHHRHHHQKQQEDEQQQQQQQQQDYHHDTQYSYLSNIELVELYANFSRNFFYKVFDPEAPLHYSYQSVRDTSVSPEKNGRQWTWQFCSELGYLQTAPKDNSIRSSIVNLQYWEQFCAKVFNTEEFRLPFPPMTKFTNLNYGGEQIKATRVIYANGSQDPWQQASKLHESQQEEQILKTITCRNCGHCVDLRGCPSLPGSDNKDCTDMDAVQKTRDFILNTMKKWITSPDA